jgi:Dna[CI] antecedent, DciA
MIARLGDLLRPAIAQAGLASASELWRIGDAWERAVGRTLAAQAVPAGFRRGELTIAAPSAVWRQELSLLGPDIKDKINATLGENLVDRVRIVAGPAFGPSASRLEHGAPAPRRSHGPTAREIAGASPERGAEHSELAGDDATVPWLGDRVPPALRSALTGLERARSARLRARTRDGS